MGRHSRRSRPSWVVLGLGAGAAAFAAAVFVAILETTVPPASHGSHDATATVSSVPGARAAAPSGMSPLESPRTGVVPGELGESSAASRPSSRVSSEPSQLLAAQTTARGDTGDRMTASPAAPDPTTAEDLPATPVPAAARPSLTPSPASPAGIDSTTTAPPTGTVSAHSTVASTTTAPPTPIASAPVRTTSSSGGSTTTVPAPTISTTTPMPSRPTAKSQEQPTRMDRGSPDRQADHQQADHQQQGHQRGDGMGPSRAKR
jgi:hypothetical protein